MSLPIVALTVASRPGLGRRLTLITAVLVLGPPLLLLAVLAGIGAPTIGGLPPDPDGPVPTTLAASDEAEVAAAPLALRGTFLTAARDYALPPALLTAIGFVESSFDPAAVGPPVPGGPAEGLMQFLPSSFAAFDVVAGATPFDPQAATLAAARHLLSSGALPGGGWDAVAALFGYNHSAPYGRRVLEIAATYGYAYSPAGPPLDPVRYHQPLAGPSPDPARTSIGAAGAAGPEVLTAAAGTAALACVRAAVVSVTAPTAGHLGSVVLRGEDGWLYTYSGLASVAQDLRAGDREIDPGTVVEPGVVLGTSAGLLTFGIRASSLDRWIPAAPYLDSWPATSPAGATGSARATTATTTTATATGTLR